jgi:hypothetical protein
VSREQPWALAVEGAHVLVGAAGTEAWPVAAPGFARILAGDEARRDLAELAIEVERDGDEARLQHLGAWVERLRAHLVDAPETADELRALIAQIKAVLPEEQQHWAQLERDDESTGEPASRPEGGRPPDVPGGWPSSGRPGGQTGGGIVKGPPPGPEFPTDA